MAQLGNGPGKYLIDRAFDLGLGAEGVAGPCIETPEVVRIKRYRLEIRTLTDVEWSTINTANFDPESKAKLRDMWYHGYSTMYPSGTEWRIRDDYF